MYLRTTVPPSGSLPLLIFAAQALHILFPVLGLMFDRESTAVTETVQDT
jgi:hypothetical protein